MPSTNKPCIAIIGLGNVGLALSQLFLKHDVDGQKYQLIAAARNIKDATTKLKKFEIDTEVTTSLEAVRRADLCLLTVKDSEIQGLCELHSKEFKAGSVVAHCSGTLDSAVLASAKKHSDVLICSIHPLNTFPTPRAAIATLDNPQHNTYLYTEGDQKALEICDLLFADLGFNSVRISRDAKPLYHAACVFASNYLVSLIDASLATAQAAGIDRDQFIKSIIPLAQATLSNIEKVDTVNALSGPIARGDADTVATHIEMLAKLDPSLQVSYADLGLRALELALARADLSEDSTQALKQALKSL